MLVRMRTTGTGELGDPVTVPLPNVRVLDVNYTTGVAICEIPLEDAPDATDAPGTGRYPVLNGLPILIALTPLQRVRWRDKLQTRWGMFRDMSGVDVSG